MKRKQDHKVIAETTCPDCGATPGRVCIWVIRQGERAAPVHPNRRTVWRAVRDAKKSE